MWSNQIVKLKFNIDDFINSFIVHFLLASDAKKCRAYGRGIQPKGVRTGDVAEFR
ncbi:unnamed protein product, partial [Rotaria socialis]